MSKREVLCTRYVEMCDMAACLAIQGGAQAKARPRALSFDDAMKLR